MLDPAFAGSVKHRALIKSAPHLRAVHVRMSPNPVPTINNMDQTTGGAALCPAGFWLCHAFQYVVMTLSSAVLQASTGSTICLLAVM
jgi:hypothetical protein